ncbi:hypothetical protein FEM48_Zijuj03G0052800 [Ziziphus jujuba var. spinosa]|uniref:Ras-related protein RABC2a n=1 Tax=Ziziphus jujuba var. spinosa TaxID=714518 RepID=A0A978VNE2_ZIZJJ|nr:hypothetical protein FEM48_Zijuj03G0052800 [Ziziphus jujuba var. spinosa]
MGSMTKGGNGNYDYSFKILLIGDSGVGKSSILLSFISNSVQDLSPTIGVDFKIKLLSVGGKRLKLTIWDTAGQERFGTLISSYYRGAHGIIFASNTYEIIVKAIKLVCHSIFIVVYDVTRRETFTNLLEIWAKEVDLYSTNKECIRILVGNKVDKDKEREVTREEGMAFAQEHRCLFLECSAKTRENVQQCFRDLVLKVYSLLFHSKCHFIGSYNGSAKFTRKWISNSEETNIEAETNVPCTAWWWLLLLIKHERTPLAMLKQNSAKPREKNLRCHNGNLELVNAGFGAGEYYVAVAYYSNVLETSVGGVNTEDRHAWFSSASGSYSVSLGSWLAREWSLWGTRMPKLAVKMLNGAKRKTLPLCPQAPPTPQDSSPALTFWAVSLKVGIVLLSLGLLHNEVAVLIFWTSVGGVNTEDTRARFYTASGSCSVGLGCWLARDLRLLKVGSGSFCDTSDASGRGLWQRVKFCELGKKMLSWKVSSFRVHGEVIRHYEFGSVIYIAFSAEMLLSVGGKRLKFTNWDTGKVETKMAVLWLCLWTGEVWNFNKLLVQRCTLNHFWYAIDEEREVTREEGMAFAQEHRCLFLECMSKTGENVQQCFRDLVLKVYSLLSVLSYPILFLCFTVDRSTKFTRKWISESEDTNIEAEINVPCTAWWWLLLLIKHERTPLVILKQNSA